MRHRNQQGRAVEGAVRLGDHLGERGERARGGGAPARHPNAVDLDLGCDRVGRRMRDRKDRQRGRMVRPLDERQPRDDLRRLVAFQRGPPGAGARDRYRRHERQIALGGRDRCDRAGGAHMRHERHREAEMEARGIAHRGFARSQIGMHGIGRLHMREGRDDDAPDALDGVERQDAAMALDQLAHHRGFARRAEGGAGFLRALDRDQVLDDLAALDQERVHRRVDAVDLGPQSGKRWDVLVGLFRHGGLVNDGAALNKWAGPRNQRKH